MNKYLRYSAMLLGIWIFMLGLFVNNFNIIVCGTTVFFIHNLIYCFENIKTRICFFMFHVMIFVFILSRPLISLRRGENWFQQFAKADIKFALIVITVSLAGLFIGAVIYENRKNCQNKIITHPTKYHLKFQNNIKIISQILFYFSVVFVAVLELEKLVFMHGRRYEDFYVLFQSQMPYFVYVFSTFMPYCLCIFLATLPKKKECIIPLGLYWGLALPELLIGMRNPIMLRSIFIFLYLFLREAMENKGKWFGRFEKGALAIATPIVLIFMGMYSSIRSGLTVYKSNVFQLLENFFYSQGVTFNVLAIGHRTIPQLPVREFRNYTFGGIIDYFRYGELGQLLWHTTPLESGNSVRAALESNCLAHNMSYIAKGEKYLRGEGWGSSYLLETYIDYGYLGVLVFSMVLGILLVYGTRLWKGYSLKLIIFLVILTKIFFSPRGAATESIEFLCTFQFWFCIVVCYLGAGLCCKSYENECILKEDDDV